MICKINEKHSQFRACPAKSGKEAEKVKNHASLKKQAEKIKKKPG